MTMPKSIDTWAQSDFVLQKLAGQNPGQHLFLILHLLLHKQLLWTMLGKFQGVFAINYEHVVRVPVSVLLVAVDQPADKTFSHL